MEALLTATSLLAFLILPVIRGVVASSFTITNNCGYTVWPGLLSSAGMDPLETTGFILNPGESRVVNVPETWSGRIWGRTYCSTDPSNSGRFTCATADCGSGMVECSGGGAQPPASLAEFTLAGSGNNDFYDVSLVDGYNLPMVIIPQGGAGANCAATGCLVDLNAACPTDLKVVTSGTGSSTYGVACKSACEAFQTPQYCCSGDYASPNTCTPSSYSQFFKNACPRAYSYAYDDATSTFTCTTGTAAYQITFCPSTSSLKSSNINPTATGLPLVNNSVVLITGNGEPSTSQAIRLNQPDMSISVLLLLLTLITCLSTTVLHKV